MEEINSVETLKRAREVFFDSYESLCILSQVPPSPAITNEVPSVLDFYGDGEDFTVDRWSIIILSLSRDRTLEQIAIRAKTKCTEVFEDIESEQEAREFKTKSLFHTGYLMANLIVSINVLLRGTICLKWLTLEGLLMGKNYLLVLLKGVQACTSIEALSFINCSMKDECVEVICELLKDVSHLMILEFSKCNISVNGGAMIADLVEHQKALRKDDKNEFQGLKRINLNHNLNLGDNGVTLLLEVIKTDTWIQAIDLQDCNLTNTSIYRAMEVTIVNKFICVIDLRANKEITECLIRQLRKTFTNTAAEPNYDWKEVETVVRYRHKLVPIIPPPSPFKRNLIRAKNGEDENELSKTKLPSKVEIPSPLSKSEEENGSNFPVIMSGDEGKAVGPNIPGQTSPPEDGNPVPETTSSDANPASPAVASANNVGSFTLPLNDVQTIGQILQPERSIEVSRMEKLQQERQEMHRSILRAHKEIERARRLVKAFSVKKIFLAKKIEKQLQGDGDDLQGVQGENGGKTKKSGKARLKKASSKEPKDQELNIDEEDEMESEFPNLTDTECVNTDCDMVTGQHSGLSSDSKPSKELDPLFESVTSIFSEMLEEHMVSTERRFRIKNEGKQYFEDPVVVYQRVMWIFSEILEKRLHDPLKPFRPKGKRNREMKDICSLVELLLEGPKSLKRSTDKEKVTKGAKQPERDGFDEIRNMMSKVLRRMKGSEMPSLTNDEQGKETEQCEGQSTDKDKKFSEKPKAEFQESKEDVKNLFNEVFGKSLKEPEKHSSTKTLCPQATDKGEKIIEYPEPAFDDSTGNVRDLFAKELWVQKKEPGKHSRSKNKGKKGTVPDEGLPMAEPNCMPAKDKGKESLEYPEPVFQDSTTGVGDLFAPKLWEQKKEPEKLSKSKDKEKKETVQDEGLPVVVEYPEPVFTDSTAEEVGNLFIQGLGGPLNKPAKRSRTKDKARKKTEQPETYEGLPLDKPHRSQTKDKAKKSSEDPEPVFKETTEEEMNLFAQGLEGPAVGKPKKSSRPKDKGKKGTLQTEPYEGLPLELAPWQHSHGEKDRKMPEEPVLYEGLPLDLSPWQYDYEEEQRAYDGLPLDSEPWDYGCDDKGMKVSEEPESYEYLPVTEKPRRHRAKGEEVAQAHYDLEADEAAAARKHAKKMRKKERARAAQQVQDLMFQALSIAPTGQGTDAEKQGSEEVPFDHNV